MSDSTGGRRALRVGTYNVRLHTPEDGEDSWDERMPDVVRNIRAHGPDLLGLQEPLPRQFAELRERLPEYTFLGRSRGAAPDTDEYSPVAVRDSALEVSEHGTFWLSETPSQPGSTSWGAAHPRIATWCRVRDRSTGASAYFYNVHLDHESATARRRAVELVVSDVGERTGDDPVVLVGDFNATPDDPAYEFAVRGGDDEGFVDARERSEVGHFGPDTTFNDFSRPIPDAFIDHVLVTPGITVSSHAVHADVRSNGRYPSDHFPLLAGIALPSAE